MDKLARDALRNLRAGRGVVRHGVRAVPASATHWHRLPLDCADCLASLLRVRLRELPRGSQLLGVSLDPPCCPARDCADLCTLLLIPCCAVFALRDNFQVSATALYRADP